jgi:hypothetical protein
MNAEIWWRFLWLRKMMNDMTEQHALEYWIDGLGIANLENPDPIPIRIATCERAVIIQANRRLWSKCINSTDQSIAIRIACTKPFSAFPLFQFSSCHTAARLDLREYMLLFSPVFFLLHFAAFVDCSVFPGKTFWLSFQFMFSSLNLRVKLFYDSSCVVSFSCRIPAQWTDFSNLPKAGIKKALSCAFHQSSALSLNNYPLQSSKILVVLSVKSRGKSVYQFSAVHNVQNSLNH